MDKLVMLQDILAQNPDDAFARYGLAMERAARGETDAALAEFADLTRRHPDYTAGYQMSAQVLLRLGREADARTQLEAGIAAAGRTGNSLALREMTGMLDEISL